MTLRWRRPRLPAQATRPRRRPGTAPPSRGAQRLAPTPARPPRYTLSSAAPTTATRAPPPPPHERIIGHLREHFHNNGSLARMFLQWDADRNGRLSVGELARLVASQGVSATPDDIAAVHRAMRQASSSSGDDDGDVRFHQFAGLLQPPGDDDGAVARSGLPLPCREVERVAAARRTAPPTRSARVAPLFQEPDARRLARRVVTTLSDRMRRLAVPSAAIRSWDTRHRGVVTGDDCRRALARYNIDLTDAELAAFLAEFVAGAGADDDDDGVPVERIVTHLFQDDDVDDDVQRYRPWRASRRVASAGAQRPVEAADLDQVDVVLGRLTRVRRASTRALFRYLDENGDGVIDRDDLRARWRSIADGAADVDDLWRRLDAGHVGSLSYGDFADLVDRLDRHRVDRDARVVKDGVRSSSPTRDAVTPGPGSCAFATDAERFDRGVHVDDAAVERGRRQRQARLRRIASAQAIRNRADPVLVQNCGG